MANDLGTFIPPFQATIHAAGQLSATLNIGCSIDGRFGEKITCAFPAIKCEISAKNVYANLTPTLTIGPAVVRAGVSIQGKINVIRMNAVGTTGHVGRLKPRGIRFLCTMSGPTTMVPKKGIAFGKPTMYATVHPFGSIVGKIKPLTMTGLIIQDRIGSIVASVPALSLKMTSLAGPVGSLRGRVLFYECSMHAITGHDADLAATVPMFGPVRIKGSTGNAVIVTELPSFDCLMKDDSVMTSTVLRHNRGEVR